MEKSHYKDILKLKEGAYNTFKYLEVALKKYNILDAESKSFEIKLLSFNHMDLDAGNDYNSKVSLWMDFVTTMFVSFDLEPIILTENDAIPNMYWLASNLTGVNSETCPECEGRGRKAINWTDFKEPELCPCCFGIGKELEEIELV